ncbi:MAG: membrane protein [Chloroflexus sp.]|uniref:metal ABC transporter permease n=1 Tax=Chloroflexus sp. TaxID=1904827 RepID=UPI0021DE909D|nr:metal ABC transporter permease [Chloroflexus sp.]GIV88805.1 MAG: membrane protein [Chloroflexus sp.]
MIDLLTAPLAYSFMQRGLIAALLVGIVCSVVGVYVVLRGMAFLGDALAHAILPGIAVGYLVNGADRGTLFWWALGTALVSTFSIGAISRATKIREDTAIGIVFAAMLALGVALISTVRNSAVDLSHFLFGNILGVSESDLWRIALFGIAVITVIILFYKELMVITFDPILAATLRLPVRFFDVLLLTLLAIAIVVAIQTVGVALTIAILVTPPATAAFFTHRMHTMMIAATGLAMIAGVVGLYASYYFSIASGSAIVLTSTLIFVVVWIGSRLHRRNV